MMAELLFLAQLFLSFSALFLVGYSQQDASLYPEASDVFYQCCRPVFICDCSLCPTGSFSPERGEEEAKGKSEVNHWSS